MSPPIVPNNNPNIVRLTALNAHQVIEQPILGFFITTDDNNGGRHYGEPVGVVRNMLPNARPEYPWCVFDRAQNAVVDNWKVPIGTGRTEAEAILKRSFSAGAKQTARARAKAVVR